MEKINLSNIEAKITIHNKVIGDISSRVIVTETISGVPINGLAAAKVKAIAYEKKLQRKLRSKKMVISFCTSCCFALLIYHRFYRKFLEEEEREKHP